MLDLRLAQCKNTSMDYKDYYKILGVERKASEDEIRRRLARLDDRRTEELRQRARHLARLGDVRR